MSYIWIQIELAMESREQELIDILGSENAEFYVFWDASAWESFRF